jgi:superfamily I DNA/RNA helicase
MFEAIKDHGNARALRRDGEITEVDGELIAFALDVKRPWTKLFSVARNDRRVTALRRILRRAGTLEIIGQQPNVDISTMHGAKGEEADVVYIDPSCNWRTYYSALYGVTSEVRLAYVALTRARRRVIITHPEKQTLKTLLPRSSHA